MEQSVLAKLVTEVHRYQNKDFLKAAMAVCALAANADDEISFAERYRIDHAISHEPALHIFDQAKVTRMLDDYIHTLRSEPDRAKEILDNKIRRISTDHKKSRTLMRVAYLIITAEREIGKVERAEFTRLCTLLDLAPDQVWRHLAARDARPSI